MIKVSNLNKYYNKGKRNELHVINDISLEFPSTGLVCILGKSGSGKSSLLNVIGCLDKADGSLQYDDVSFSKYEMSKMDEFRNKYIGYIFQNFLLLPDEQVWKNIDLALSIYGINDKDERHKRVDESLKSVGLAKYRRKQAKSLSGGQKQRVAIARALAKLPKVIIADEPTGNLDEENSIIVMDILKDISKSRLVIMVTHNERLAKGYADSIIRYADGKAISIDKNTPVAVTSIQENDDGVVDLSKLNKENVRVNNVDLEVYSDDKVDLSLKVIKKDGKTYLFFNQNNVIINPNDLNVVDHVEKTETKEIEKIDSTFNYSSFKDAELKTISFASMLFNSFKRFFSRQQKKTVFFRILTGLLGIVFATLTLISYSSIFTNNFVNTKSFIQDDLIAISSSDEYVIPFSFNDYQYLYNNKDRSALNGLDIRATIGGDNFYLSGAIDCKSVTSICDIPGINDYGNYTMYIGEEINNTRDVVISKSLARKVLTNAIKRGYDESILIGQNFSAKTAYCGKIVGISNESIDIVHFGNQAGNDFIRHYAEVFLSPTNELFDSLDHILSYNKLDDFTVDETGRTADGYINVYVSKDVVPLFDAYYKNYCDKKIIDHHYNTEIKLISVAGVIDDDVSSTIVFKDYVSQYNYLEEIYVYACNRIAPYTVSNDIVKDLDTPQYGSAYYPSALKMLLDISPRLVDYTIQGYYETDDLKFAPCYTSPLAMADLYFKNHGYFLTSREIVNQDIEKYDYNGYAYNFFDEYAFMIKSNNVSKTLSFVKQGNAISPSKHFVSANNALNSYNKSYIIVNGVTSIVLSIVVLAALILMISLSTRSNISQHNYTISVYRSIGANRKFIQRLFASENLVSTTFTLTLGVILANVAFYIVYALSNVAFVPPYIGIASVVLMYLVTYLSTLIPLSSLLRKTPHDISIKFDI